MTRRADSRASSPAGSSASGAAREVVRSSGTPEDLGGGELEIESARLHNRRVVRPIPSPETMAVAGMTIVASLWFAA